VAWRLIPREHKFFDDFSELASELVRGAKLLEDLLGSEPIDTKRFAEINAIENACDQLTYGIIQHLHRTFITPFDREDIHELARSLDDVMDAIDQVSISMKVYKIREVRFGTREMARLLTVATQELCEAVAALQKTKGVTERALQVKRLEHEIDLVHQDAISRLFSEERDPIEIMKWKEILDILEEAADRCEDVANVLESVVVKHA